MVATVVVVVCESRYAAMQILNAGRVRQDPTSSTLRSLDLLRRSHAGFTRGLDPRQIKQYRELLKIHLALARIRQILLTSSLRFARSVSSLVPPADACLVSSRSRSAFAWASLAACRVSCSSFSMLARRSASASAARCFETSSCGGVTSTATGGWSARCSSQGR